MKYFILLFTLIFFSNCSSDSDPGPCDSCQNGISENFNVLGQILGACTQPNYEDCIDPGSDITNVDLDDLAACSNETEGCVQFSCEQEELDELGCTNSISIINISDYANSTNLYNGAIVYNIDFDATGFQLKIEGVDVISISGSSTTTNLDTFEFNCPNDDYCTVLAFSFGGDTIEPGCGVLFYFEFNGNYEDINITDVIFTGDNFINNDPNIIDVNSCP